MKPLKLIAALVIPFFPAFSTAGNGLSLLDRNPFIWPGFEANKAPPPAQPGAAASSEDYEFHAVYELSGKTHVLLRDRRQNEFHWVRIGESLDGLVPKSYDGDKDQLLLAYDDQEKWLSLQSLPEVKGGPVAAQPPARAPTATARTPRASTRSRTSSSPIRRSVVRPRTSSSSNIISPRSATTSSSSSSGSVPSRASVLRGRIRQATDPGVSPPSFVPEDPGPPPSSEPPESNPGSAPEAVEKRTP